MTRSELIQIISQRNPGLDTQSIEKILLSIFEEIQEALATGKRVELRGFGAFSIKKRSQRIGRNPRTGQSIKVDEKIVPFFKAGKQLREELNLKA